MYQNRISTKKQWIVAFNDGAYRHDKAMGVVLLFSADMSAGHTIRWKEFQMLQSQNQPGLELMMDHQN